MLVYVNIWYGRASFFFCNDKFLNYKTMKKIKAILCVFLLALLMTSSTKTTTIFVIGDSTAAEKGNYKTSPERGWGMVLQGCFDDRIIVDNHAVNGRSSLSFLNEGRWQKVLDKIKPDR